MTLTDRAVTTTETVIAASMAGLVVSVEVKVGQRVEVGDLARLDAAYARTPPSSDDRAYLERRIVELETKAKVKR